jgi:hypothetical protein
VAEASTTQVPIILQGIGVVGVILRRAEIPRVEESNSDATCRTIDTRNDLVACGPTVGKDIPCSYLFSVESRSLPGR